MSRYQEHFTPSQVSLASTQYRAREKEKDRLLRSHLSSQDDIPGGFAPAPMATPTWTSTPAPALTPTPASEQGPRRQGPGLYGPSQVRRPPPRHPFRPRMTTVPMPLAPQNQDRDRDRAQGTTAFMMDMNMNMNNVPPHPHSYPHANANTSAGVGASLNAPSGDPGPSASASATQQQVPPPPAILLTTDSRGNSPIVLQSEGLKGSENRNGNGAQAQPPPQPQILPQPKKRDKHDEEKEREKERRDRARLLAGLAPSPRREAPRFSGITSPTSVSISRSSIPPALMPGGGIEVPTGVHITSKADTGRFKPTKSDIALGEPDLNLHVEKGLKNIVGKVVKGIRGLKALGAFAGGDGGNRETLGWKADREQVSSRRPGGFFGEDSALNASPDGYEGGYYSSHRDGNPPEGTPGAGPSTTPMHTSRGLSTSPPPPPPQQQQQQQRPQFRTRAHTPAPSEAPTFMTSATGVTGTVRGHSPPSREDFMLQDFMRKKRIMRDKAFKAGRGFWNGVPSEKRKNSNGYGYGYGYGYGTAPEWATTSPPTILPPGTPSPQPQPQPQPQRQSQPQPHPSPNDDAANANVAGLSFPEPQLTGSPGPQTQADASRSQDSLLTAEPDRPTTAGMNINQLDALRAAEEEREEADKRRAGWRARRTTVPDEDGGGASYPTPTSIRQTQSSQTPFIPPAPGLHPAPGPSSPSPFPFPAAPNGLENPLSATASRTRTTRYSAPHPRAGAPPYTYPNNGYSTSQFGMWSMISSLCSRN